MGGGRDLGFGLTACVALFGVTGWLSLGGSWDGTRPEVWLYEGPPVFLLAMLFGSGTALAARRRFALDDAGGALRATMLRGLLLVLLGLVLGTAAFIFWGFLVPLGIALMAGAVALLLPTWAIAATAAVLALGGGWVIREAVAVLPYLDAVPSLTSLVTDPYATICDVLLTGSNPSITMLTAVLLGIVLARVLARADEHDRRRLVLLGIAVLGAVAAVGSLAASMLLVQSYLLPLPASGPLVEAWFAMLDAGLVPDPFVPYSGSPLEVARMAGLAMLSIALIGLLVTVIPPRVRPWAEIPRLIGASAISLYAVVAIGMSVYGGLPGATLDWLLRSPGGEAIGFVLWGILFLLVLRSAPFERAIDALAERGAGGRQPLRADISCPDETSLEYELQFRAPISRVWAAHLDRELVLRWIEQAHAPILRMSWDAQPGGQFRITYANLLGTATAVGTFEQIIAPTTLVQSMGKEGQSPAVTSTDRMFEFGGITTVRTRNVYRSRAGREIAIRELRADPARFDRLQALVEAPASLAAGSTSTR